MKCPGHQKKEKKKASQNPDFLLSFFVSLVLSELV